MQKLTKLYNAIFTKFLFLVIFAFLLFVIILYYLLQNIYVSETKNNLLLNAKLILLQIDNFNNISKIINNETEAKSLKITLITKNGQIIKDSENRQNRYTYLDIKEVIQAVSTKNKFVIKSQNIFTKTIFTIRQIHINNAIFYIILSKNSYEFNKNFIPLILKLLSLLIILTLLISLLISKSLQDKLKKISNISKKREKQKQKYTAKLKVLNNQKDNIIYAISHEFKNPIMIISGYAQTLLRDNNINIDIRNKFTQKILNSSHKLTNMIDRLRLSIQMEQKSKSYKIEPYQIDIMTKNIISDLQIKYPSRKIRLKSDSLNIKADKTMFNIVIENLIENALKHSQSDVTVEINKSNFKVINFGQGITKKEQELIVKKFHSSSKNWHSSLGIGLYLVDIIIKIHKFKLSIQSKKTNSKKEFKTIFKIEY